MKEKAIETSNLSVRKVLKKLFREQPRGDIDKGKEIGMGEWVSEKRWQVESKRTRKNCLM
jgi:hypothetical protein